MRKAVVSLLIFLCSVSVFSQEWGLVLAGGGGKGAYQIGVWKALCQYGLDRKITAISGTSVGGLNAALVDCLDPQQCQDLWCQKVPSKIRKKDQLISQEGIAELVDSIDLGRIRSGNRRLWVTTVSSLMPFGPVIPMGHGTRANRILLNAISKDQEMKKSLLATSAFPVLTDPIQLSDGYYHIDGGGESFGGDNLPIDPIVDNCPAIRNIFVVYLSARPGRKIRKIDYEEYNIVEIIPSTDLGNLFEGTINFDRSRIELLIQTGYQDCVQVLERMGLSPVSSWWF